MASTVLGAFQKPFSPPSSAGGSPCHPGFTAEKIVSEKFSDLSRVVRLALNYLSVILKPRLLSGHLASA